MWNAQAAEPLFLSKVRVDVLGQNPEDARMLGMEEARKKGLASLLGKFVPEHKDSIMDGLSDKKIKKIVRKVDITNETVTGERFRADVQISYSAAMFNDLITQKIEAIESDQQLLTTASLILPVFETSDRLFMFESTNPWGAAWKDTARNIGRGQLVTPFGDSVDHTIMSAEKALDADFKEFSALRRRYGVRDVVVLSAKFISKEALFAPQKPAGDEDEDEDEDEAGANQGTLILQVKERRVQAKKDEIKVLEYIMDASENKDKLMERAARDLGIYVMNLQNQTASEVNKASVEYNRLLMVMPVTTMRRFAWIKERINLVPGVEKLEVLAVKSKQADVQVLFTGTREVLLQSMLDAGLKFDDRTKYLELRL